MPRHGGKHVVLVKGAEEAMRAFKMEIAEDLGLADKISEDGDFRALSTVEVGTIGGEMVRRLQALGEKTVKDRYDNNEDRLLPVDLLPKATSLRSVSNNGNVQPNTTGSYQGGLTEDHSTTTYQKVAKQSNTANGNSITIPLQ